MSCVGYRFIKRVIAQKNPSGVEMSKNHPFSIYLLKSGYTPENSLVIDHGLIPITDAGNLPAGGKLYVMDSEAHQVWWRAYFGIPKALKQETKGALAFISAEDRWFALTFGHMAHNLKDESYEYDFGTKITLNCIEPKIKSTDTLNPGTARRQRTQMPSDSDLTFFDINMDSTIVRSLTGRVKAEYKTLFKSVTGTSSVHIETERIAEELPELCKKLLELYKKEDYKTVFPHILDVEPVQDPAISEKLDSNLITAFHSKDLQLSLTVPDIVDYADKPKISFSGVGPSKQYAELSLTKYHEYLSENGLNMSGLEFNCLKKHRLILCDSDGKERKGYSIYKSLLFDTKIEGDGHAYHLCEGNWYKIEQKFVEELKTYLDAYHEETTLPPYTQLDEGKYNIDAVGTPQSRICLDTGNIAPDGQYPVEPCDLYEVHDGKPVYIHIKVSTRSQKLSHLFNQGMNAIDLLNSEQSSKDKLKALLRKKLNGLDEQAYLPPVDASNGKVLFVIATRKPAENKSDNLPLFSRMTLRRIVKAIKRTQREVGYAFIPDARLEEAGTIKTRKKRTLKTKKQEKEQERER